MIKLKLIKGLSYYGSVEGGTVSATAKSPVVSVPDADVARLLATGYFALESETPDMEVPDEETPDMDTTDLLEGEIDFEELSSMKISDLQSFADEHGIDISGRTKKTEILETISVALGGSQAMIDLQK